MNPFELYGPQFLLFYAALTVVTIIVVNAARKRRELERSGGTNPLTDPYLIACLRGGKNEVIRTAIISLVDRGLLEVHGDKLQTTSVGATTIVRKPIELALVRKCGTKPEAQSLFSDVHLEVATLEYETQLAAQRLLPDDEIKSARRTIFFGALVFLLAVAGIKAYIGVSRGRPIAFLVILTFIALILTAKAAFPRLTAAGKALLADIRTLFDSLRLRAAQIHPGGASPEVALLVAVFGMSALTGDEFRWTKLLFPRAASSTSSSCGSSSGSSCGSSCGGGGGGGGCGGCGG